MWFFLTTVAFQRSDRVAENLVKSTIVGNNRKCWISLMRVQWQRLTENVVVLQASAVSLAAEGNLISSISRESYDDLLQNSDSTYTLFKTMYVDRNPIYR